MARFRDGFLWDDDGWRMVSHDPHLGRTIWHYQDPVTGANTWRTEQDVDKAVKENAEERNSTAGQKFGDWRRIASIPLNMWYDKLDQAHREGDEEYVKRWLNDGDNRAFRTFEGKA
jgi:hypothetical protein